MKVIKVFIAGWLLVLGIIGCQREEEFPQAPILNSPQDGAVFQDQAPVFIWQSVDEATEYIIRISKDSFTDGDLLVEDTLADTTYAMPQNVFESADTGTYTWAVACLLEDEEPCWSESRTFQIENQIEETVAQRLYSTYFPMDVDYEWVYEREVLYWDDSGDLEPYYSEEYEVTVKVDSMTVLKDGWVIFHLNSDFFLDVGNDVLTNGYKIVINDDADTISTDTYQGDFGRFKEMKRTKGLGVVYQREGCYEESIDHLKYFRKGDTIWRYE